MTIHLIVVFLASAALAEATAWLWRHDRPLAVAYAAFGFVTLSRLAWGA